jgi:hypothetical protein
MNYDRDVGLDRNPEPPEPKYECYCPTCEFKYTCGWSDYIDIEKETNDANT